MASEAEVKAQFISRLATLLPQLEIEELQADQPFRGSNFDFVARVRMGQVRKILLGVVKSSGQPRFLRQVIAWFKESGIANADTYFVIAAPYVSPRGMEICRRHKVGCVDLAGNCYLEFDGVYIERIVEEKPEPVRPFIRPCMPLLPTGSSFNKDINGSKRSVGSSMPRCPRRRIPALEANMSPRSSRTTWMI